jgi:hypothetical protein
MKVLVLSYAFDPVYSACSVRWSAIVERWADIGLCVDVVAAWQPGLLRHEERGRNVIFRTGGRITRGARARLGSVERKDEAAQRGRRVSRWVLSRGYYGVWRKVYWPDHAVGWAAASFPYVVSRLRAEAYDAVVSVAFPFSDHVLMAAALRAHSPLGRRVRPVWLADYGDPFSFLIDTPPNNPRVYGRINRWADLRILASADVAVMPNQEMKALYVGEAPWCCEKINIVPHLSAGWERHAAGGSSESSAEGRWCYAGAFAKGVRTPEWMLRCFAAVNARASAAGRNIVLDIVGAMNDCAEALEPYGDLIAAGGLVLHGQVSPERAMAIMANASVLVNVGNTTAFRQPSKVVSYMASGKPIVNFATGRDDSSIALLAKYPAGITIAQDMECDTAVSKLMDFVAKTPQVPEAYLERHREEFGVVGVAQAYVNLIETKLGARV